MTSALPAAAEMVAVFDAPSLLEAISAARPGDEIVLADGTYALSQNVNCSTPGTESEPIVVRAEHPRKATIEFDALEGFKVGAAHWTFQGLTVRGVCDDDDACEHAFHVFGEAHSFVLRDSRISDFNAQLKVNALSVEGTFVAPDHGLVERCDVGDSRARFTDRPVTKLNIDGGKGWIVRDNYIHDFHKDGGNTISYGAFMKSGGQDGVFERNWVVCDAGASEGGARIGLSLGGGGTDPRFCAPAYDEGVACDPEHTDGTVRNNVITACSDVGIYLNRAEGTRLLYNTLIGTTGIDFRYTSTGTAIGNVVSGPIRDRDGGQHTAMLNLLDVSQSTFDAWYADPLAGDLTVVTEPSDLLGRGTPEVSDDLCGRARPTEGLTLGAVEHTLGDCEGERPWNVPAAGGTSSGGSDGAGSGASGGAGSGASDPGTGAADSGGGDAADPETGGESSGGGAGSGDAGATGSGPKGSDPFDSADAEAGCGCKLAGHSRSFGGPFELLAALLSVLLVRARRRTVMRVKSVTFTEGK